MQNPRLFSLEVFSSTMSSEDNTMSKKLNTMKFKITYKGKPIVSEDTLQGDVSNNVLRDKINSTASHGNMSTTSSLRATSRKRQAETSLDTRTVKKQKMEGNLKLRCRSILKKLMERSDAWVFSKPVDPVKWKIPDYFEIITNPMDLGTVKHKLEGNEYSDTEEFASDIRLTFDNAMAYNLPASDVHILAKRLNDHFTRSWKSYEASMKRRNDKVHQCDVTDRRTSDGRDTKQSVETNCKASNNVVRCKDSLIPVHAVLSKPLALNERTKSRLEMAPNRCSLIGRKVENGATRNCGQSAFASSNHCRSIECSSCDNQPCSCMPESGSAPAKCSSCDSQSCSCLPKSDITSERSAEHDRSGTCEGIDSDGCASFTAQMSPEKALRAAMLKSRYAGTIYKARQQGHQVNSDKPDPAKLLKERERFERQQEEEKARIEAQIKASQEASRMKAHNDLMLQRERERAAARISLQKVEKTVEIDENQSIIRELEQLCYGLSDVGGIQRRNPLEGLGLYIKEDEEEEEIDAILNAEEGEIL